MKPRTLEDNKASARWLAQRALEAYEYTDVVEALDDVDENDLEEIYELIRNATVIIH